MLLFSLPAFTATPIGKLASAFKLVTPLAIELEELRDELEIEELLELLESDELRDELEIDELLELLDKDELRELLESDELRDELLELEILLDELLELETEELRDELEMEEDLELELKLDERELELVIVEQTDPCTTGFSAAPVLLPKNPNIIDWFGWITLFQDMGVAA